MVFFKNISKHILNNIRYISVFIFFFALFIGGKFVVWSLLFLILNFFYEIIKNKITFRKNKALFLMFLLYLIHILSVLYSVNKDVANFDLQVKLSLLIFPLFFVFIKKTILFDVKKITNIYIISAFIISIALIINLAHNYFINKQMLYYTEYSTFLHPSYFALYIDLGIVMAISAIAQNNKHKILYLIAIALFLVNIFFTDAKSGYIASILILVYIIVFLGLRKSKYITITAVIILSIVSFFILKSNPRFKTTFDILSKYENVLKHPENKNSSTSMRILAWNASSELIKNNLIFGVGSGDIKTELNKKYNELNYKYLAKYNLNSHNQFLETWLGQGLIGFILLLLIFIIPFISAIKHKNIVLQAFLLLMFINFLFESMLNTQAGTIFFGFFYSFLVVVNNEE